MRRQRIADEGTAGCNGDSCFVDVIIDQATESRNRSAIVEKLLQNGDLYVGGFSGNAPHGRGKYLWADGCMYEGEWRRGRASGKGKFSWTSGATFEGEFKGGRMEGFGTFIGADGDTYCGSWIADQKHGSGRKSFVNGDFYEGQWRRNLQEGNGSYLWCNGNQFVGEWRGGVIAGRGVLIWANGNRYEGQWENGAPKGSGVFTWIDGSCYIGCWSKDPVSQQQFNLKFYPISAVGGSRLSLSSPGDGVHSCMPMKKRQSVESSLARGSLAEKNFHRICIWDSDNDAGDITCDIIDSLEASMDYKDGQGREGRGRNRGRNQCCFEPGEMKRLGQTILKGHKNYDLMINFQLGIRYTVGKPGTVQPRELKPSDFDPMEKFWMRFPSEGSKITPPHQSVDFKWKDYCPLVFRHLRKLFEVDPANYMIAICGDEALRELSSPGKSGSLFYLTQDDRFIIKTVKKCEVKVLIKMLSSYYQHVSKYMNSLLTKFYGVHCVKPVGGTKVRFIVIGNLFCSEYIIHRRFDLKGSSHGRSIHKSEGDIDETTTMKDLDLNFVFHIPKSWFNKLIWQIERDCQFLEAEGIMDYSLLVGVHFRDHEDDFPSKISMFAPSQKICIMKEYLRGEEPFTAKVDSRKLFVQLGANMPARAEHVFHMNDPDSGQIYEVILYFGIIDILQDYDIGKKLERAYKSLQVDSTSISAVDPRLYSQRFRNFMGRVFVEDD